jgi:hypothetical protein
LHKVFDDGKAEASPLVVLEAWNAVKLLKNLVLVFDWDAATGV